jgi:hypothetical protein
MPRSLDSNHGRDWRVSPRDVANGRWRARAVVDPLGTRWPSLSQAGAAYGLTSMGIRYRAEMRVAGWRFAEDGE